MPTLADSFLSLWGDSALTTLGFFWKAAWAFALGYLVSSLIQLVITKGQIRQAMGKHEARGVAVATGFGFISSSCSFAALSTTRALFAKGASLPAAMAFMLASTNLVIELGIVIAVFLSWQFVVGEYLGGLLLILFVWGLIHLIRARKTIDDARDRVEDQTDDESAMTWSKLLTTRQGWSKLGMRYAMEWQMVWKDVTVGFTVAGIIAAFVPAAFFQTLFVGSGGEGDPAFWQVLVQAMIGPVAAFFTFIGSMGNIPLAALLYGSGVSFAGVMAFIFSDLVVFPVLRINAKYYGWKMALYLVLLMFIALVAAAVVLHYGFAWTGFMPETQTGHDRQDPASRFAVDYTLWLNLAFILASAAVVGVWLAGKKQHHAHNTQDTQHADPSPQNHGRADKHGHDPHHQEPEHQYHEQNHGDSHGHGGHHHMSHGGLIERTLFWLALLSYAWLLGGLIAYTAS